MLTKKGQVEFCLEKMNRICKYVSWKTRVREAINKKGVKVFFITINNIKAKIGNKKGNAVTMHIYISLLRHQTYVTRYFDDNKVSF